MGHRRLDSREMPASMILDLIRSSREGIRESDFFLALGTENYARSIRNPADEDHHLIVEQIAYAKSLGKPAAILLEVSLTSEDEKTIRAALEGMDIIGVFKFESGNEESMKSAVIQISKAIDKTMYQRRMKNDISINLR